MKFSIRDLLLMTVIVALVVALIFTKRQAAPGRYTIIDEAGYLLDTQTGQVWRNDKDNGRWQEYRPPVGSPVFEAMSKDKP